MLIQQIETTGVYAPGCFLAIFIAASFLMIWRLEAMSADGFEGTVLGTLIMPYCSGIGNLIFALLLAKDRGPGAEVMTNALVNNVTNLTLLIGLPALLWQVQTGGATKGKGKKKSARQKPATHRLSVLLTLLAGLFFVGVVWALGRDGKISFDDGLVLVGLFLFWQCFHVYEVLKDNANSGSNPLSGWLVLNLVLLGLGAYASYLSINWLVDWLNAQPSGFLSAANLGWLSGWMMVLPNAILALYYGWRRQPEVVYASQAGDGHICIPLCIGLYALFRPLELPAVFLPGVYLLVGASMLHLVSVAVWGQLPRLAGFALIIAYGYFLKTGLPA